jgi:cell division protein FtsL
MSRRGKARSRRRPWIVVILGWLAVLLSSLSLVTWRQTTGVEMERALGEVRAERGVVEADRLAQARRVDELRSRARIVRVARERLGMHVPDDREVIFLPVGASGVAFGADR